MRDLGADIIKIETKTGDNTCQIGPSRGEGMTAYFASLNRNKRSVGLGLKRRAAKQAMLRLVEIVDVFVHNMRIGAAKWLGLDYSRLAAWNKRPAYASVAGFRKDSSTRDDPAFDDLIQGPSGATFLNAGPDGAPCNFPTVLADKLTGLTFQQGYGDN